MKEGKLVVNITCSKHPKYKGKKEPRAKCWACRLIYEAASDGEKAAGIYILAASVAAERDVEDSNDSLGE